MSQDYVVPQRDVRTAFIESPPASFTGLPASDQRRKLACRPGIETDWDCDIQDSIPLPIIPRQGETSWTKVKVGEHGEERPWWLWAMNLFSQLKRLSKLTKHDLERAQKLMLEQVALRQTSQERKAGRGTAEILATDIAAINDALMKQSIDENGLQDVNVKRERFDSLQPEQVGHKLYDLDGGRRPSIKLEQNEQDSYQGQQAQYADQRAVAGTPSVSGAPEPPRKRQKTTHSTSSQRIEVLEFRAKAMRHRQEAARLEAEAYELEARSLSDDACTSP